MRQTVLSDPQTDLQAQPSIPSIPDHSGLLTLVNAQGDSAVISLYGAQLLSWKTASGRELLYCTPLPAADMKPGAAIRGGVPVCFPQFAGRGPLPKHGFVRNVVWQSAEIISGSDQETASARLSLSSSLTTQALWPHDFSVQLHIELGAGWVSVALDVDNTGSNAFDFTAALHTYLATSDVTQCEIHGLEGARYLDSTHGHSVLEQAQTQTESVLRINKENDRIYLSPATRLQLHQHGQPYLQLEQQGFNDSVVWNPGPEKAAQLGDMPASDWRHMLCIEAAQIAQPVQLQPGTHWRGQQRLLYRG